MSDFDPYARNFPVDPSKQPRHPKPSSMDARQVYDPSTDTYYSSQGLLMESELLGRYKRSLDSMFIEASVGTMSLDELKRTAESHNAAKVIIELYKVTGANIIHTLLSQKIRAYIDRRTE